MSTHHYRPPGGPPTAQHGYTREAIEIVLGQIEEMLATSEHNAEHLTQLRDAFSRRLRELEQSGR
jgi:hypothetical protein